MLLLYFVKYIINNIDQIVNGIYFLANHLSYLLPITVAKPLHVGHLRSAIIGEALKRIITATGRTAIGDVHLGDWGLPMGLVLAELEERYGDDLPILTTDLLNEIYPNIGTERVIQANTFPN